MQRLKITTVSAILAIRRHIIAAVQSVLFVPASYPRKILLHRIGTFGDSIVALPAVSMIRSHYPDARIDFATTYATTLNLSVIVEEGVFDTVHLIEKKNRSEGVRRLKDEQYDLYIEIPQNYGLIKTLRNMLIVRFVLGIRSGFGWDEGMSKLFAREQLLFRPPLPERERFIRNLERNGISGKAAYPLRIQKPEEAVLDLFRNGKVIALVIGTNVPANMWPFESWRSLAESLTRQGYSIAVIGGEQEREKGDAIVAGLERANNFCGLFSIAQSAGFLQFCTGAICHDTGAMHLAYAVDIPLVVLFSPRQLSSKWFPPKEKSRVLMNVVECAGCFRKTCEDNICMTSITPQHVEAELFELIKANA